MTEERKIKWAYKAGLFWKGGRAPLNDLGIEERVSAFFEYLEDEAAINAVLEERKIKEHAMPLKLGKKCEAFRCLLCGRFIFPDENMVPHGEGYVHKVCTLDSLTIGVTFDVKCKHCGFVFAVTAPPMIRLGYRKNFQFIHCKECGKGTNVRMPRRNVQ